MKIDIVTIGRNRPGPARDLWEEYAGRIRKIGPGLGFRSLELREFAEAPDARAADRMASEAQHLLDAAGGSAIIALDERGDDVSSADFSELLGRWRDDGSPAIAFLIGGPDGLDGSVRKASRRRLRFGRQTWPHLVVRALLAEQIYRAMTIMAGHPYHRP